MFQKSVKESDTAFVPIVKSPISQEHISSRSQNISTLCVIISNCLNVLIHMLHLDEVGLIKRVSL